MSESPNMVDVELGNNNPNKQSRAPEIGQDAQLKGGRDETKIRNQPKPHDDGGGGGGGNGDEEGDAEGEGDLDGDLYEPNYDGRTALRQTFDSPSLGKVLLQILFISFLTLAPAFLLYLLDYGFSIYNIFKIKGTTSTNPQMEYIRICIVIWAAMCSWVFLEWLVGTLPISMMRTAKRLGHQYSRGTRRMITYFVAARFWFALLFWIVSLAIIGALLLYQTSIIQTVSMGLFGKKPDAVNNALSKIGSFANGWYYFERFLLVAILFSILFGLGKYLSELISAHFHHMAFEERVSTLNYKFDLITKLHSAVKAGSIKRIVPQTGFSDCRLVADRKRVMVTEKKALDLANDLFVKLVPVNRDYLTIDNLRSFFNPNDLERAFSVFDPSKHGDVTRSEIQQVVLDVYKERLIVARAVLNNNKIVQKLEMIFLAVATLFTFFFSVPIFDASAAAVFVVFGLLWSASGFLFQSTARMSFESVIFLFAEHPYDVGDRVIIDGEYLTVEQMEIFTTIFRRWDGTAVYIPNSKLSEKNIYNIRRSGAQSDLIDIAISGTTSISKLWMLRNRLCDFTKGDSKDYTGIVELEEFTLDGGKIKLKLLVQYRTNFQDAAIRAARRNKFIAMIKQLVGDLEIEYFP